MLNWRWRAMTSVGAVSLAMWLFWLGWTHLGPRKPEVGPLRRAVLEQMVPKVVEDLRLNRGTPRETVLLHFENDTTDQVTLALRAGIEQSGALPLRDQTILEKARHILRLRHPAFGEPERAIKRGRRMKAEAVLFGRVIRFEASPQRAFAEFEVTLAETDSGETIFSSPYSGEISSDGLPSTPSQSDAIWLRGLLAWIVTVLLLPVFTITFLRAMVRKRSNAVNAFTLGMYSLADITLAYLLFASAFDGWKAGLALLLAALVSFAYNARMMLLALKLET